MAVDDSEVDRKFGERLKAARKAVGVSQEELAELVTGRGYPMHLTAISRIEQKNGRKVTIGEAVALANALGYTLEALIGGGQDEFLRAATLASAKQDALQTAAAQYAESQVALARAADEASNLRDGDNRYLDSVLTDQTPARIVANTAALEALARVSRDEISIGDRLGQYLDALVRDEPGIQSFYDEVTDRLRESDG